MLKPTETRPGFPALRDMFNKVTKGALSGNAGETPHEEFKINGQYVNTPEKGIVGIPFFDRSLSLPTGN
jgi:arylsulfatase